MSGRRRLTVGSVFAGIGGLELGLESTGGFETRWQIEIDEYAVRVLEQHWPNVPKYGDIRKIRRGTLAPVDVICGGFPCQDISYAGEGAGLSGARSGLWFQMLRLVRMVRPKYVIVENVAALLNRGLDLVLAGLAQAGYDAEWRCIRASDVGAPHRRERVFILAVRRGRVAHSRGHQPERRRTPFNMAARASHVEGDAQERERSRNAARDPSQTRAHGNEHVAHAHRDGCVERRTPGPPELEGLGTWTRVDSRTAGRAVRDAEHVGVAHRRGDSNSQRRERPEDAHEGRQEHGARRGDVADADRVDGAAERDVHPRQLDPSRSEAPLREGADHVGVGHGTDSNSRRREEPSILDGREGQAFSSARGVGEGVGVARALGDSNEPRPQGRRWDSGRSNELSSWPPGPADADAWRRVLEIDPGLEPAIARPQSPVRGVASGIPGRVDRLRALGNSVVPQVAAQVGRRVLQIEAEGW